MVSGLFFDAGVPENDAVLESDIVLDVLLKQLASHEQRDLSGDFAVYFAHIQEDMNLFHVHYRRSDSDYSNKVVRAIHRFIPVRDRFIRVFLALAERGATDEETEVLGSLFESLLAFVYPPKTMVGYSELGLEFDNFRYCLTELFLYALAALVKFERFTAVDKLLARSYCVSTSLSGVASTQDYTVFKGFVPSFNRLTQDYRIDRISLRADFLRRNQADYLGIDFIDLAEVDFSLFMRKLVSNYRQNENEQSYYPDTLANVVTRQYYQPFPVFKRCQSHGFFDRFKRVLDLANKQELAPLFKAINKGHSQWAMYNFGSERLDPIYLMNYQQLASKP